MIVKAMMLLAFKAVFLAFEFEGFILEAVVPDVEVAFEAAMAAESAAIKATARETAMASKTPVRETAAPETAMPAEAAAAKATIAAKAAAMAAAKFHLFNGGGGRKCLHAAWSGCEGIRGLACAEGGGCNRKARDKTGLDGAGDFLS